MRAGRRERVGECRRVCEGGPRKEHRAAVSACGGCDRPSPLTSGLPPPLRWPLRPHLAHEVLALQRCHQRHDRQHQRQHERVGGAHDAQQRGERARNRAQQRHYIDGRPHPAPQARVAVERHLPGGVGEREDAYGGRGWQGRRYPNSGAGGGAGMAEAGVLGSMAPAVARPSVALTGEGRGCCGRGSICGPRAAAAAAMTVLGCRGVGAGGPARWRRHSGARRSAAIGARCNPDAALKRCCSAPCRR
jgi:hypothetical protein